MQREYVPVLILFGVSLVNAALMIGASHLLSTFRPTPVKAEPYESGIPALGDTRERFSVKFYVVAMLFLLFDVEAVFLIAWAVVFRDIGLFGYSAMLIFLFLLVVGLIYEWRKGALEWD